MASLSATCRRTRFARSQRRGKPDAVVPVMSTWSSRPVDSPSVKTRVGPWLRTGRWRHAGIDMYPLFGASQFREGRDLVLLDLNPVADPEICARALVQAVDTSNDDRFGHGWLRRMPLLTLVNSYRPGSVGLRELIFEASTTSSDNSRFVAQRNAEEENQMVHGFAFTSARRQSWPSQSPTVCDVRRTTLGGFMAITRGRRQPPEAQSR